MAFNCMRCCAETDNDCDICDDCLSEARDNEAVVNAADRLAKLRSENERLRAELKAAHDAWNGLHAAMSGKPRAALTFPSPAPQAEPPSYMGGRRLQITGSKDSIGVIDLGLLALTSPSSPEE